MTRYEKFLEERRKDDPGFLECIFNVGVVGGEPVLCSEIQCEECDFNDGMCAITSVNYLAEEI